MNLFERCDQSASKIIGTWNAVTCQELLLCTTFNNVSGNPHRSTDSQASISMHGFIVTLRSTPCFPGLDVLQSVGTRTSKKVSTRQKWMKTPGSSISTNKITICSHFHIDRLQLFHKFFFTTFDQLGTVNCLCSKLILSRPLALSVNWGKDPAQGNERYTLSYSQPFFSQ